MTPTVALMLKAPVGGRVKTRLAADIGEQEACLAYRRLVEHQIGKIPVGWRIEVHVDPPDAGGTMRTWLGSRPVYVPQAGGDLGVRLSAALNPGAAAGTVPVDRFPVIFLGGDCPYLDEADLVAAEKLLESHEVVLGPAVDGGYVLIGMNKPHPELFQGIEWSTEHVLGQTLERARRTGLSVALLPEREDVDDLASWNRAEDYLNRRQQRKQSKTGARYFQ